jgi:hypothetical protein
MATILEAIEEELSNMTPSVQFHYEDLELANATIFDKLSNSSFPLCLVLPFDINDVSRENGKVKSEAEINAIFLNKITGQATIDEETFKIDSELVSPMRTLARQFINRLDEKDIIDEDGITSVVHRSTHQAITDAHLYGCWSVFTVKFSEDLTTCPPD